MSPQKRGLFVRRTLPVLLGGHGQTFKSKEDKARGHRDQTGKRERSMKMYEGVFPGHPATPKVFQLNVIF